MTDPILITGCSTGIGRATAARLAGRGHTVYATARKTEALGELKAAGCRTLALDVTDEASMAAAVDTVVEREGAVGALVTTRATRSRERSRRCPWTPSLASSRPTSSA